MAARILLPLCMLGVCQTDLLAQSQRTLDSSWTATVNNQIVPVNDDGTFRIPNIAVADNVQPFFVSDDFFRVVAFRGDPGSMEYAFSEWFQLRSNAAYEIEELTFTTTPPPSVQVLTTVAATDALRRVGAMTQLRTQAQLNDGSQLDVTNATEWTTYRTSNRQVVTVDRDGLVRAVGNGVAFVTAVNDSVSAVERITVSLGDPGTDVCGFVRLPDGSPAPGAQVTVIGQSVTGNSARQNGKYRLDNALALRGPICLSARLDLNGTVYTGMAGPIDPTPDGLTDAGFIDLREGDPIAYVAKSGGSLVCRFDLDSQLELGSLNLPADVGDLDVNSLGDRLMVAGSGNRLFLLDADGADLQLTTDITLDTVPSEVESFGDFAVLDGTGTTNEIHSRNFATGQIISQLDIGFDASSFEAFPMGSRMLAMARNGTVRTVDVSNTGTLSLPSPAPITLNRGDVRGLTIRPDGIVAVALHETNAEASLIDIASDGSLTERGTVTLPAPAHSAVWSNDATQLYLFSPQTGRVWVFDDQNNVLTLATEITGLQAGGARPVGIEQMILSTDERWLAIHERQRITLIDTGTRSIDSFVGLISNPNGGAICPGSR